MADDLVYSPTPEEVAGSQLTDFETFVAETTGQRFDDFAALHRWSVEHPRAFWASLLAWCKIVHSGDPEPVLEGDDCKTARFFPALRLNFTENLLAPWREEERIAVSAASEAGRIVGLTGRALDDRVRRVAAGLRRLGVGAGDRVIAVAKNDIDSIVAALATVGLGATWSSVAPDLGAESIIRRFEKLDPRLLFACRTVSAQGVTRGTDELVDEIASALPTLRDVVSFDSIPPSRVGNASIHTIDGLAAAEPIDEWTHFDFNHPLYVLFSSGTTGEPKCIVHSAGGTLLEHLKEHRLHGDFSAKDRLYFHTTCGWMMWNWQLSALASGTTIVVYDGSPTHPRRDALWHMVAEQRVTVFGTSPAYLHFCRDKRIMPSERCDVSRLRLIQSTGSILYDEQYDWIVDNVKRVPVQSISGGTDIIGCFVLGNPNAPSYRGESQCFSLGLDVRIHQNGKAPAGELICANPFPSRPLAFLDDDDGQRFHDAYFAAHDGVWTHGDFLEIAPNGGIRMLGRSDGVLNVRGVRIGPAELYHVVQSFDAIEQCVAVDQRWPSAPGGSRVVLLVTMNDGRTLDQPLEVEIKDALRKRASAAHVPAVIAAVSALPTTFSNKVSERATREAVHGHVVENRAALKNPECLDEIRSLPALG